MDDPRLRVAQLDDANSVAPDVIVLDGINGVRAEASARAVPNEAWDRIARGDAKLVLDASGEGQAHSPARTDGLHDFLRSRGVDLVHVAYVNQDRGYAAQYGAYCDALGLGRQRMAVWVHDRYIQTTFAPFRGAGEAHFEARLKRYASARRARPRRFICLNNMMRPARTLFLLRLLQQGLWDQGFISMGRIGDHDESASAKLEFISLLRSSRGFGVLAEELLPFLDELMARGPAYIGVDTSASENDQRRATIQATAFKECSESWFTVVTETQFDERLRRITEKPFKPLLNFHPFIVLGSVSSLQLIRAYGFDTYPGVFDEHYDDVPDRRTRFDMVFDQVSRLCRMDDADIALLDELASETAVFNAWWGLVELPNLFRSHIDASLIDRLISLWRPEGSEG